MYVDVSDINIGSGNVVEWSYVSVVDNPTREQVVDLSDFTLNDSGNNITVNIPTGGGVMTFKEYETTISLNWKCSSQSGSTISVPNNNYYYVFTNVNYTCYLWDINENKICRLTDSSNTDNLALNFTLYKPLFQLVI